MKTKITAIILSLAATLGIVGLAALSPAYAAQDICSVEGVAPEVKAAAGCDGHNDYDLGDSLQSIVNGIILFLGTVAVIVIVIGGVSYMTAAGDAGKLQKAKNTILYACIGLIICVLSFAIVNFTIGVINGNSSSGGDDAASADFSDYDSDLYH